jgi:hypothetical protein
MFDPSNRPNNPDDYDDEDNFYMNSTQHPLLPKNDVPNHNEALYSSGANLQHIYNTQESESQDFLFNDHVNNLVYHCFGFNLIGTVENP